MDYEQFREDYDGRELHKTDLANHPVDQFDRWFSEATDAGVHLPDAMTLATAGDNAAPSVRSVVLRGFDRTGFRFFTHLGSQKAAELRENPRAALKFYWDRFHRQVRLRGPVEPLPREEVETYFGKRPRESQIAAHVSGESETVESRDALERVRDRYRDRFEDGPVPCPDDWGGFRLHPDQFIFWQGRNGRLHDRFRYRETDDGWTLERLTP